MTLKPNPEYALCEQEMSWFSNPAARTITVSGVDGAVTASEKLMPLRWRTQNHRAVILAWNEGRYEDMQRLCVPSHIAVEDAEAVA
jgi:hypothetical protein